MNGPSPDEEVACPWWLDLDDDNCDDEPDEDQEWDE